MEQKWVKGAPIHWSYAEPILAVPVVHFITAKPPHPNASKVFQEFVFSIPALSTWANQGALVDRKGVTDNRKVKNEAWYVFQHDPNARILKGLMPGVTCEQFKQGIEAGNVETLIKSIPVRDGDCCMV